MTLHPLAGTRVENGDPSCKCSDHEIYSPTAPPYRSCYRSVLRACHRKGELASRTEGDSVRKPGRMLGVLLLVALAACASEVSIGTAYDPLAVFPRQGTFAWAERPNVIPEQVAHLGFADLLPPAVEGALAGRGWQKATPEAADLLVSYELSVATLIQVATPDSEERSRAMATLSVALLDPEDQRRRWVGFIQADVTPSLSHEERRSRIEEVLGRLFTQFPP